MSSTTDEQGVAFPITVYVGKDGEEVEAVIIPASEYAALLAGRGDESGHLSGRVVDVASPAKSPIERDGEVAAFLAERFGRVSMERVLVECRQTFGDARTPSRAAAARYWMRLRKGKQATCIRRTILK